MNAVVVMLLGLAVAGIGYRLYARYVETRIIKADPGRATPAKMYMDGVEFMPTSRHVLLGYQFKSIAGAAPIIGPIIAIQWGWLPALLWILLGTFFIGWVQDYCSAMMAIRNDGAAFGGLSHRLVSPRARLILLAFIYFYLLLLISAYGNVVVSTAIALKAAPMAWVFLTAAGVLASQMIYRWRVDILLTTLVTVGLALAGIGLGAALPSDQWLGAGLANSRLFWAGLTFLFCSVAAILPIWKFALPINYVAAYVVFLGMAGGIVGVFIQHPTFTLPAFTGMEIKIGPLWPIMFVTIACGAISGWHSVVSSSGTARQIENELDVRPVCGGCMFLEMLLALFALVIAGTIFASPAEYAGAIGHGPGPIFAAGMARFLGALYLPEVIGRTYGSVMMVVLAITLMQLAVRFMRVAVGELLRDVAPLFRHPVAGTALTSALGIVLVLTGWWQYLWVLFGGANQLMASLALMLITIWLLTERRPAAWTMIPMVFMFVTTIAALAFISWGLFKKVWGGQVHGEALVGNTVMGVVGVFLVGIALLLAWEGAKAIRRLQTRAPDRQAAQPEARA